MELTGNTPGMESRRLRQERATDRRRADKIPQVLVVDDEALVLDFLRDALSAEAYHLHRAENGQAALAAVAAVEPDVILLDLGLPDLSGIEVIRRIRGRSQVPIIVISVQGAEDDKVSALDVGADDYLSKPFGVNELRARIRAVLRRPPHQPSQLPGDADVSRTSLSAREREVLLWVREGKCNWDIAKILAISERTVKFHLNSVMHKLDAVNRSHAVALAIRYGMIDLE